MSKIMLVEDDATMRLLLKTLLELDKHQVVVVSDPMEDISRCVLADHPDILIMDVYLRSSNGIETLKQLRQMNLGWKLNILMTSGMDLRKECMEAGADGFLLKPFMPVELNKYLQLAQTL